MLDEVLADAGPVPFSDDDLVMHWGQLRDLRAAGHEIGSHSCTHEILPLLDDADLEREVAGSRQLLEHGLSARVDSFCYPNGDVDGRVVRAVVSAGYACAASTASGRNPVGQNPYRLCRRFIHQDRLTGCNGHPSPLLLRAELCGLADRVFSRKWRLR
jgi:peptidoglycan/xylan/chitin deacetylase (PgdA/CDA1 family)